MRLRTPASILLLLIGISLTIAGSRLVVPGFRMAAAPVCSAAGAADGCLRESTGTIELTGTAKGGTEYWGYTSSSGSTATVTVQESNSLDDGPATAYRWDGEVVLLQQDDGPRVESAGWGPSAASGPLGFGLALLGGALLLLPPRSWALRLRPVGVGLAVGGGGLAFFGIFAGWWVGVVFGVILGAGAGAGWVLARSAALRPAPDPGPGRAG